MIESSSNMCTVYDGWMGAARNSASIKHTNELNISEDLVVPDEMRGVACPNWKAVLPY